MSNHEPSGNYALLALESDSEATWIALPAANVPLPDEEVQQTAWAVGQQMVSAGAAGSDSCCCCCCCCDDRRPSCCCCILSPTVHSVHQAARCWPS